MIRATAARERSLRSATELEYNCGAEKHRPFFMKYSLWVLLCMFVCSTCLAAQASVNREDGIASYRSGEFEKAANILQTVVEKDKSDKLAWIYLGAAFVKLGKQKEAVIAFKNSNFTYKDRTEQFDQDVKTIWKPRASYTDEARMENVTGTIKIAVEYGADGKIGFIFPFQTLPDGLTNSAVRAAKLIEFKPATKGGKPVTSVTIISYSFEIY
jgi:hypothetical protein